MCGISGIYSPIGNLEQTLLEKMASSLRHRGPDHTGFYISPDRCIGLAHNRLSIIDLTDAAHQPMISANGKMCIAFNGEIYNFTHLRDEMKSRGHIFRSHGDTETMLELYCEKGQAFLQELNGMFAFCIYDAQKRTFFLARDRVGIKPLYYTCKDGHFAFASEIKPLLCLPFITREIDAVALDSFFTFGYIPDDLCIFRDIQKLRPAHSAEFKFDTNKFTTSQYWNLDQHAHNLDGIAEQELAEILDEKLCDAVRMRMISDVPIGCFLSGGLDSSMLSAIMAEQSNQTIKTFNISFSSGKYDESPYARIVAEHIGSHHTEHRLEMNAVSTLYELIDNYDEPFADSSMIPTYYVSKMAREQVTVALSGDGGDELFGGYNWYSQIFQLQRLQRVLGPLSKVGPMLAKIVPDGTWGRPSLSALGLKPQQQMIKCNGAFDERAKLSLYTPEYTSALSGYNYAKVFQDRFASYKDDLLQKMTKTDFNCYLPNDILTKVDRASMAVSLEVRVPWLDHRIAEFAFSLPSALRICKGRKKYLPKLLAKKWLPKDLPLERKKGFCIPINDWMRGDLGRMLEDHLQNNDVSEYVNVNYVFELLRQQRTQQCRHCFPLFTVLIFALWYDRYITS